MNNFKSEVTLTHYRVPVTPEDFDALTDYDHETMLGDEDTPRIDEALEQLYCCDIDYNGHFGHYIYFALEPVDDTPETWKAIEKEFDKYIKLAHKWLKENIE